jgi:hypothetical protein
MVHVLLSEAFDVFLNKLEVGLVRLDRVGQIILVDLLAVVTQEAADGLDAGGALKVLRSEQFIQVLLEGGTARVRGNLQSLEDAEEDLLEALEVPVLIDDGVDNAGEEDLLGLVGEEVHEIVQKVDLVKILRIAVAPLGEELLAE